MRKWRLLAVLVLALSILFPSAARALAPGPMDVVRSTTLRVMDIVSAAFRGEGPSLEQRREEILGIVDDAFDFKEMSRRALGRPWKDQPPAKQGEFVGLFTRLLFNTYVKRVEAASSARTEAFFDDESIDGDYAVVKTRIRSGDTSVRIDYRLIRGSEGWKVYDVVVEDVSLVGNYRHQFASILNRESFDELLAKMREKSGT
jgi:phospholipid transport system substrate-binding protein